MSAATLAPPDALPDIDPRNDQPRPCGVLVGPVGHRPCPSEAVVAAIVGCVHGHIETIDLCAKHLRKLHAGSEMWCSTCEPRTEAFVIAELPIGPR